MNSIPPAVLGARILIVDDQAICMDMLEHLLTGMGYSAVFTVADPRLVCALHEQHRYDLIVLDLNMPSMSGFEVLAGLKLIEDRDALAVLAVSAEPDYKLRALKAGARDFLCKPFDHVELLARIRNILEAHLLYTRTRDYGQRLACYEAVTGLPNRFLFEQSLARQLREYADQRCGVMLVSVDGIARVVDRLGQAVGDDVLRQFGQRLSNVVQPGSFVAGLGGVQFALVQGDLDSPQDALQTTQLVARALALPFCLPDGDVTLHASIGIAMYPCDAGDGATLIMFAGIALHRAEQDGRGCCRFFTDAMNEQSRRRFELENALRKACDEHEFEVVYQPKVQISTGCMIGAEALLRWNRPGHGQVSPVEFVPLLEETGLIVPVGAWVIDTVCAQIAAWKAALHRALPVAVNVASLQFSEGNLEQVVAGAIARHRIDAHMLGLEVTESALMRDTEGTVSILGKLRAMGVHIAIDDFGTGYSSLAYLKCFPLDSLKIDIAFIREMTTSAGDLAMVDAIIAMGHSLDLDVIAEGVETAAQLACLGRHRCDQIQGYLFSRPVSAQQFGQMLSDGARMSAPLPAAGAHRTLLLVDDESHVLKALERLLRQDGYRILSANGAGEAFALLAENEVQVIVCDQRMEEMSGTVFLGKVKDMYPDTLRIILSGYTELDTIIEAINVGALYRFYLKPWDNEQLRENIAAAFRHHWQLHGAKPNLAVAAAQPRTLEFFSGLD